MKTIKSLTLLLIPVLFFMTSCTIDWNDEKDKKITELQKQIHILEKESISPSQSDISDIFSSRNIGIRFESFYGTGIFGLSMNSGNPKILFLKKSADEKYLSTIIDSLEIFYINQNANDTIKNLIEQYGSHPNNCEIIPSEKDQFGFTTYSIDLRNKNIIYSEKERKLLEKAKLDSKNDDGPTYLFTQKEIYNKQLLNECGKYAIGAPPATSRTYGSYFISGSGTTTLLYHPAGADPSIIKWGTLELFDPIGQ